MDDSIQTLLSSTNEENRYAYYYLWFQRVTSLHQITG